MKTTCDCTDSGKLVTRLTLALLMIPHGIAKLAGLTFIVGMLTSMGLPGFIAYGVYIGELVAPLMIIIGFRARLGAALMVINMVFAIALAHGAQLFEVGPMGGMALELQYFFLFIAVAVMLLGAGKYAVSTSHKWD